MDVDILKYIKKIKSLTIFNYKVKNLSRELKLYMNRGEN